MDWVEVGTRVATIFCGFSNIDGSVPATVKITKKLIGKNVRLQSWGAEYVTVIEVLKAHRYMGECLFHTDCGLGINEDVDYAHFMAERPDGRIELWACDDNWMIAPPEQLDLPIVG